MQVECDLLRQWLTDEKNIKIHESASLYKNPLTNNTEVNHEERARAIKKYKGYEHEVRHLKRCVLKYTCPHDIVREGEPNDKGEFLVCVIGREGNIHETTYNLLHVFTPDKVEEYDTTDEELKVALESSYKPFNSPLMDELYNSLKLRAKVVGHILKSARDQQGKAFDMKNIVIYDFVAYVCLHSRQFGRDIMFTYMI